MAKKRYDRVQRGFSRRTFDGKKYTQDAFGWTKKKTVERRAKWLRAHGYSARRIKSSKGYTLYKRKK